MNQASFHCPQCQQMKLFQQQTMNHTPHILASVFLCGLWLPVWLLLASSYSAPWMCSFCGYSNKVQYLADPSLQNREHAYTVQKRRIYEQTRNDRAGSTFQEYLAYFISDNKKILIIIGALASGIGVLILISTFRAQQRLIAQPPVNTATNSAQINQAAIDARTTFGRLAQLKYEKRFPGLVIKTDGATCKNLLVDAKGINAKFVDEFRQDNSAKLKETGIISVYVSNGKDKWSITPY